MRSPFPGVLLGALVVCGLSACTPEEQIDTESGLEAIPETPLPEVTGPPPEPATTAAALTTTESAEYGTYVADSEGRALYLLEADPQGQSTCYDACAIAWPPYLAPGGSPTTESARLEADLLGTLERRDGATQVTYGGHPLYYYAEDSGPAETAGQDVHDEWGEWYLVTPSGEPLEEESPDA